MFSEHDHSGKAEPREAVPFLRVLVIEDSENDIILTRNGLRRTQRCQFDVEWAQTLAEGMERLREGGIDVVLLDLALPDSRGLESFDRVNKAFHLLPVVVLSGNEDEEIAVQTVRRGAQDYLTKNHLDPDTLGRVVTYAFERKQALLRLSDLTDELRVRNAVLREELELAHEIQRALLPGTQVKPPGLEADDGVPWTLFHRYLPIDTLAGDFFKVYPLSRGRIGILICDVMGHGVRSALIAALLSGLIEEYEFEQESPAWMITRLNTGLLRVLGRCHRADIFATACYVVVDPRMGTLEVCSAGHPAPYLLKAADGQATRIGESRGPALGIFDDAAFSVSRSTIDEDDFILLYTDGLSEVEMADGSWFESKIADILSDQHERDGDWLLDTLIAEATRRSGGGGFIDDVCLVGLRVGRSEASFPQEAASPAGMEA